MTQTFQQTGPTKTEQITFKRPLSTTSSEVSVTSTQNNESTQIKTIDRKVEKTVSNTKNSSNKSKIDTEDKIEVTVNALYPCRNAFNETNSPFTFEQFTNFMKCTYGNTNLFN